MERSRPAPPVSGPAPLTRILPRLFTGLTLCGLGIAMMVRAELGLGPWDVLHQGLSVATGITVGAATILVGAAVLLLWVPLHQRPGIGTLSNVLTIGVVLDLALGLSGPVSALWLRWVLLLAGPLVFAAGSAVYIGAGVGTGPRDGVMTGLEELGVPIALGRTAIELSALGVGWLLGGTVGVGTVYFALIVGPAIHVALPRLRASWYPPGAQPRVLGRRSGLPESGPRRS